MGSRDSAPDGYQEVPERIEQFYTAYPDGRLESRVWFETLPVPRVIDVPGRKDGDKVEAGGVGSDMVPVVKRALVHQSTFVICEAKAYRTPDDPTPCVGIAAEPFPGTTPYTKDSEVMNAETSAWGRALVATGVTKAKVIASKEEVRNRRGEATGATGTQRRTQRRSTAPPVQESTSRDEGDPSADAGLPHGPYEGPPPPEVTHDPYQHDAVDASGTLPEGMAEGAPPPPPGVDPTTGEADGSSYVDRQRERITRLISDLSEEKQGALRQAWKKAKLAKPSDLTDQDEFDEAERLIGTMWEGGWGG